MVALAAALIASAGCGGGSASEATVSAQAAERSRPAIPQGKTPGRLIVKDLIEGTGAVVEKDDFVFLYYVAGIYERGEEIESRWVKGSPLGFLVGRGSVLQGWEDGVPGMRVGGRRQLLFPTTPEDTPIGSRRGETLVYIIDLIEVRKNEGDGDPRT